MRFDDLPIGGLFKTDSFVGIKTTLRTHRKLGPGTLGSLPRGTEVTKLRALTAGRHEVGGKLYEYNLAGKRKEVDNLHLMVPFNEVNRGQRFYYLGNMHMKLTDSHAFCGELNRVHPEEVVEIIPITTVPFSSVVPGLFRWSGTYYWTTGQQTWPLCSGKADLPKDFMLVTPLFLAPVDNVFGDLPVGKAFCHEGNWYEKIDQNRGILRHSETTFASNAKVSL